MAGTHPNAYRQEALDLRQQARQLLNLADQRDAEATELEKELGLPNTAPPTPADQLPPGGRTVDPETDTETDTETEKKSKVPFKK